MDGRESPERSPAATRHAHDAEGGLAAVPGHHGKAPASLAGVRIPPFLGQRKYGMSGQWPLQDFLELGARVSAAPCARLYARHALQEWGLGSLGENTELLVGELVANAVKASQAGSQPSPVRLWMMSDSAQILILVWDASPHPPVRIGASEEAENGRGLMLVEAISNQWGWCPGEDSDGKFVWAVTGLPSGAMPEPAGAWS